MPIRKFVDREAKEVNNFITQFSLIKRVLNNYLPNLVCRDVENESNLFSAEKIARKSS